MTASVLILEDEEAVAFTLREILADEGYHVEAATTTAEALAKIDVVRFDAALLDLRVGEESGLSVLARLKEASPSTVALILTGYGSLETAVQAMRHGAFDYLLKPCDVGELKAAIARGLEQRRLSLLDGNAEATRAELEQALERALRARDDFLEMASHELKTPLSVVIGWAQYVQRQLARGVSKDASEKLQVVVQQSRRLARMIEAFTDVVRIQHGALALAFERLDLRPQIEIAVRDARGAHPGCTFQVKLPDQPVTVLADASGLGKVFSNLIENGAKFSPQGGEVTVHVHIAGTEAVIAIRDLGIGIAPEEAQRIFERFYQADHDIRSRSFGGMGIGLFLSQALVEAHGGRIWAESAGPNQGSTFTIALPLT